METCSFPECDQPGTIFCNACKTKTYCCRLCETNDWSDHKEACEIVVCHKVGMAYHNKAMGIYKTRNWTETLRYCDLALGKFNAVKKRPLEVMSVALSIKCESLQMLHRLVEFLQCAEEKYNLWAVARGPAHPRTIEAAFYLIEGLMFNGNFEDANLFAHTLWEIIHTNNHVDNDIPGDKLQEYVATAAYLLAQAIYRLDESGGLPPEEKQKAGEEAIARARQSLEIRTQLFGAESRSVATVMGAFAAVLDFFSDGGDDEALRLNEQAIVIFLRVDGISSPGVAACENNLGLAYYQRATRVRHDIERYTANMELALPHLREASSIYRDINHVDAADRASGYVIVIEEDLRQTRAVIAAVTTTRG